MDNDFGGNRGYSLSFSNQDSYATTSSYIAPSDKWPVAAITITACVRYTGFSKGGMRGSVVSVIANGDTNHIQPFFLNFQEPPLGVIDNIFSANSARTAMSEQAINSIFSSYWTKMTAVYNTTGTTSSTSLYFNGTLVHRTKAKGSFLRWSDKSAMFLGGYAAGSSLLSMKTRFNGWVDDLAFYNRAMTDAEIAQHGWAVPDVADPSLVIYYNFEEGPGAKVIKNLGSAGPLADLLNGKVLGSAEYTDLDTQTVRAVAPATYSPGAPGVGMGMSVPLTFAVDAGATARLRVSCLPTITAGTGTAAAATPTQSTLNSFAGSGLLYQADAPRTPLPRTALPARLTSSTGEFW